MIFFAKMFIGMVIIAVIIALILIFAEEPVLCTLGLIFLIASYIIGSLIFQ